MELKSQKVVWKADNIISYTLQTFIAKTLTEPQSGAVRQH